MREILSGIEESEREREGELLSKVSEIISHSFF